MRFIPEAADQEWIVSRLAELLRERGSKQFLDGPIFEPTSEFFPDEWRADERSVRRLLRRVMQHAGLADFPFELTMYEHGEEDYGLDLHLEHVHHVGDAAAWFAGLDDDGTAHFGVARENLQDPEALVAIVCHEVAHAFRARHGLTYFDEAEDELLTDLTTVFLGFGLITTNLTRRYRTRREGSETKAGGYLSPVAMSFAVAVQMVSREIPIGEAKRLARHLEAAQEGCFLESYKELASTRARLMQSLGLGKSPSRARTNEGHPVWRIRGGWFRKPRCSGLDCGAPLGKDEQRCPGCGGRIRGDVADQAEATRAESALAAEAGSAILKKLGLGR